MNVPMPALLLRCSINREELELGVRARDGYRGEMTSNPSTLERAFALARSGEYASVGEIRARLRRERCDSVDGHLSGPSITKQLRLLCDEARRRVPSETG